MNRGILGRGTSAHGGGNGDGGNSDSDTHRVGNVGSAHTDCTLRNGDCTLRNGDGAQSSASTCGFGSNGAGIVGIVLCLLLSLALAGCTEDAPQSDDEEEASLTVYLLRGGDPMLHGSSSLESNVRQAAATFADEHPEISVEVHVGIPADSAVTADDALRALNASLISGEGPDVIVLDGMPFDHLIDQGFLRDLSQSRASLLGDGTYFDNILDMDGKGAWAIPATFMLPVAAGNVDLLAQFNTADELAALLGDSSSVAASFDQGSDLSSLLAAFYPSLIQDGQANRTALRSFLAAAHVPLAAGAARAHESSAHDGGAAFANEADYLDYRLADLADPSYALTSCALFLEPDVQLTCALMAQWSDFGTAYLNVGETPYPSDFKPLSSDAGAVFMPSAILGVNAQSPHAEEAEAFIAHMLSPSVQESLRGIGIPVSQDAFDHLIAQSNAYCIGFAGNEVVGTDGDDEDDMVSYERGALTSSEIAHCKAMIAEATCPVIPDQTIVEVLAEALRSSASGEATLDEAAEAAAQKIDFTLRQ